MELNLLNAPRRENGVPIFLSVPVSLWVPVMGKVTSWFAWDYKSQAPGALQSQPWERLGRPYGEHAFQSVALR